MLSMRKTAFKAALDRLGADITIKINGVELPTLRVLRDLDYEKSTAGEFQLEEPERRYRCFSDDLTFDVKQAVVVINNLNYTISRSPIADDDGLITYLYLK